MATSIIGVDARAALVDALPVTERRLDLAGVSTAVLEGGEGPPLVLLHGPGGYAAHWLGVIGELVATHHVLVPDLPGHGASEVRDGPLDAAHLDAWLDALVTETCEAPPALVGNITGGTMAARYTASHPGRVRALVLVDCLGLVPFEPAPEFGQALAAFAAEPDVGTHRALWAQCAHDVDGLIERMGARWQPFAAYNIDRARTSSVMAAVGAQMQAFAMTPLPPAELDRIDAPTTLIWGRQDLATPVAVAQAVSARHDWPLHVIEECADAPPIERPGPFLAALRAALDDTRPAERLR